MHKNEVNLYQKIIAIGSYMTGGWIGIFWQIYSVITKREVPKFLLFHIYQSIFITLTLSIVFWLFSGILHILNFVPFINILANTIERFFTYPIIMNYSLVGVTILLMYLYLFLCCFTGKISKLPLFSEIISEQIDRF